MGLIEIRLGDEDIERFAPDGCPEWVPFDRDALDDAPFDVLHPLEKEMRETDEDLSIQKIIYFEWVGMTALGIKGAVWLAWKFAGIDTPPWSEFNIRTNRARFMRNDDDADPPASGSSEPSPETDSTTDETTPSTDSSPS